MSDINNPPPPAPPPPPTYPPPSQFPPLPEAFAIPAGVIGQWLNIPWSQVVEPKLARQEWEFLFFGLTKMVAAHQALQECLVKWSNSETEAANKALDTSKRMAIEADNQIRQFFMAIMATAKK